MQGGKRRGAEGGSQARRSQLRAQAVARQVNTTLGELIAAAFDIAGNEVRSVARLVSSSDMTKVIGRRILLT
jgi:hypothetical protein